MCIELQQAFNEVQFALVETVDGGATISSANWTVAEIVGYFNQRQARFLKETAILMKRAIVNTPTQRRHALPLDWLITQRIVWRSGTGAYIEIPRGDGWEADQGMGDWDTASALLPALYMDAELPTLTFQTAPVATDAGGRLEILYVYLAPDICTFEVPYEFVQTVIWGVLADCLLKVGRGHNPTKAQYAEQRWQEGVEAARLILQGWA